MKFSRKNFENRRFWKLSFFFSRPFWNFFFCFLPMKISQCFKKEGSVKILMITLVSTYFFTLDKHFVPGQMIIELKIYKLPSTKHYTHHTVLKLRVISNKSPRTFDSCISIYALKFLLYVTVLMPVWQYILCTDKTAHCSGTYNRSFRVSLIHT